MSTSTVQSSFRPSGSCLSALPLKKTYQLHDVDHVLCGPSGRERVGGTHRMLLLPALAERTRSWRSDER